jgi:hypothetical protein
MTSRHPADLLAIVTYVAGGGLGVVGAAVAIILPGHAALIVAVGLALASVAGLVRTLLNPTPAPGTTAAIIPTNTVPVVATGGVGAVAAGVAVVAPEAIAKLTRA